MTLFSSQTNMRTASQRPKLSHIAKLANTTPSTVSKVINGRSGVSDETRQRIEALLKDMEYSKPPVKHALSTTIMLVLESMENPWVLDIMQGATDAAVKRSMTVTICAKKRLRRQPQRHLPASNPPSQTQSSDFRQRLRANARSNTLPRTWSSICGNRPIRNTMQRLHGCAHRQLDRRIRNRQPSY